MLLTSQAMALGSPHRGDLTILGELVHNPVILRQLEAEGISPTYYVKKQAIYMVIGTAIMVGLAFFDYRRLRDWALMIYGFCVFMLLAVYVVGHKSKGAQAWFQIGSYQLEPSEFAKIGLILALAAYCAAAKGKLVLKLQALRRHHRQFLGKVLLFLTCELQALITRINLPPVGNRSEFPTDKASKYKE